MAYFHQQWNPKAKPGKGAETAQEEVTDLGRAVVRWQESLQEQYPDLLGHLVWNGERLAELERAAQHIIENDPWVDGNLVSLYRRSLINRVTGLGPLDELLLDESVNDIMVNGPDRVFCDRNGVIEPVSLQFGDAQAVISLAQRLAARAGRMVNTEVPLCDAELFDGSRIHCAIPPVADVPCITIRRGRQIPLTIEHCLASGTFSPELWHDLHQMVAERLNIIVAGGAGSGKTSLLRLLASAISPSERIVVIEDVRELKLSQKNLVSLETTDRYGSEALLNNALRMRPDRILVGEVRGAEVLALMEAMSTGHPGSLSTVHSRAGGIETLQRLARIAVRHGSGLGFTEMMQQVRNTVDVIVYTTRYGDGSRRVSDVSLVGPDQIQPLWQYQSVSGEFVRFGKLPC